MKVSAPEGTLLDHVTWNSQEHRGLSRGMIKSGAGFLKDVPQPGDLLEIKEECWIMTRRQSLLLFNISRTSVFDPALKGSGGVIWWRTRHELVLARLHEACVHICSEVGFSEFCVMCAAKGVSAPAYWQEMLGENYRYIKRRM